MRPKESSLGSERKNPSGEKRSSSPSWRHCSGHRGASCVRCWARGLEERPLGSGRKKPQWGKSPSLPSSRHLTAGLCVRLRMCVSVRMCKSLPVCAGVERAHVHVRMHMRVRVRVHVLASRRASGERAQAHLRVKGGLTAASQVALACGHRSGHGCSQGHSRGRARGVSV